MRQGTNVIYAFFDERGQPFYVGRTNDFARRFRQHRNEVVGGNTLPKYNKLRKILSGGVPLKRAIQVVESGISYQQVKKREQYWVAEFIRRGHKLTNLTEGGYGGFRWTKECRKVYSEKKKALGLHHSVEVRRKLSVAKRGKKFTIEHRLKLSIARRKRVTTDETREKMRKAMKGRRNIKSYRIISPRGKVYLTTNGLILFCEEHGLTPANMHKVANGERPNHKGWRCERINST